jgi:type IX secretion system PorP/SprF family membrane protein
MYYICFLSKRIQLNIKCLLSSFFVACASIIFAQDIHFSQFFNSPLTLNPSKAGDYDGDWSFMNNYRRQWGSFTSPGHPFKTISVGLDKPFSVKRSKFALGLLLINDAAGSANYSVNKIYGNIAYHKKMNKQWLHFGVQAGYVMKGYTGDKLTFPNQYDNNSGTFNPDLSGGEASLGEQVQYLDINAGLSWSATFRNLHPEIGISFFHVNMPNESYVGSDAKLPVRQTIHAGAKWFTGNTFYIHPNLIMMNHSKASNALMGSNFGYLFKSPTAKMKSLYLGIYFRDGIKRNSDSFIAVIGSRVFNFDLGFSYDFNVSELKKVTHYKGGFEISLIYIAPSTKLTQVSIPCERF